MKKRVIDYVAMEFAKPEEAIGERIETKVARIMENNEPIKDGAPIIYTEKKLGVMPAYDIRTDRFDVALEAYGKIDAERIAKKAAVANENKTEGSVEPINN